MKAIAGLVVVGLAVLLVVAIGVINRGGTDGASNGAVTITLEDLRFSPRQLSATVGVPLTVRLVNRGQERHDLRVVSRVGAMYQTT